MRVCSVASGDTDSESSMNWHSSRFAYATLRDKAMANCRASGEDDGAKRMAGNYAAIALAWRYLCEFAGMDPSEDDFPRDLLAEMNGHVAETSADREPWIWIMETALSEMDCGNYKHPYTFDTVDGEFCLLINTGHVMDHIAHTSALRDKLNVCGLLTTPLRS